MYRPNSIDRTISRRSSMDQTPPASHAREPLLSVSREFRQQLVWDPVGADPGNASEIKSHSSSVSNKRAIALPSVALSDFANSRILTQTVE